MNIGYIYKAQNTLTGEVYIGVTTSTIDDRIYDHLQKAEKKVGGYFQEAIGTYGPEAFTWEQIDTAHSLNELAEKESRYIELHNSIEEGYNRDRGGGFQKLIYRYNLEGNFDRTFETLSDASLSIGVRKQDISRACWSVKKKLGDYLWSYNFKDRLIPEKHYKSKSVHQFNLEGNFMSAYKSASEASRQTGISKTCITRCCRGERKNSGGFIWQYNKS